MGTTRATTGVSDPSDDGRTGPPPRNPRLIALIVATALLMENLDSSVLSTSLPQIAVDLGANPIHLKLALTSYLLALAIFIPASGWAADRFGARLIFRLAIVIFAAGSIACGLSSTLPGLVAARVLQGMGGALMVPVGRLVVLRSSPRAGLVGALAWLTVPALIGPVIGPPLGGFVTTYFQWRWIFWINVPIAVLGLILATIYIPDIRMDRARAFDGRGFLLLGPGLVAALTGLTVSGLGLAPGLVIWSMTLAGFALVALYARHAFRSDDPLIDLRLVRLPTFRISVGGGTLFRIGSGALPFLLPLMLQVGFGISAFQSGMLTFASGAGALLMKFAAQPVLRRYGFRSTLIGNGILAALFILSPAFFTAATPAFVMVLVLLIGGFTRSLQFTALNAMAYADVPTGKLSSATSFSSVVQQLSASFGITVAAFGLEAVAWLTGGPLLGADDFPWVFGLMAAIALASVLAYVRIPAGAGSELLGRPPVREGD